MGKIKGFDATPGVPIVISRRGCKTSGAELQKCKTSKSGKCSIAGFNLKGHCGMKIKKYHPFPNNGGAPRPGAAERPVRVAQAPRPPEEAAQRQAAVPPPVTAATANAAPAVPMNALVTVRRAEKRPAPQSPQKSPRPKRAAASRSSDALKKYYERGAKLRAEREAANKKRKASDEGTSSSAKRKKK